MNLDLDLTRQTALQREPTSLLQPPGGKIMDLEAEVEYLCAGRRPVLQFEFRKMLPERRVVNPLLWGLPPVVVGPSTSWNSLQAVATLRQHVMKQVCGAQCPSTSIPASCTISPGAPRSVWFAGGSVQVPFGASTSAPPAPDSASLSEDRTTRAHGFHMLVLHSLSVSSSPAGGALSNGLWKTRTPQDCGASLASDP